MSRGRTSLALARYRGRWTIETLFANLKTRGLRSEATHITDPGKLETLMALMAIATVLAAKTGAAANRTRPIPLKKHGRKAVSHFALGLAILCKILAHKTRDQIIACIKALMSPKIPPKSLSESGFDGESSTVGIGIGGLWARLRGSSRHQPGFALFGFQTVSCRRYPSGPAEPCVRL